MSAPKEWINFDCSFNLMLERIPVVGRFYAGTKATENGLVRERFPENVRYGDIVKGLPIPKSSCCGVYASHVLEHLSLSEFRIALKHTFDYLKKDGFFRLIVPDLKILVNKYVSSEDLVAALKFIEETGMGTITRQKGLKSILQSSLGGSQHLWMWDFPSLKIELEEVGFTNVRRASFNDSQDEMFKCVEEQGRFVDALCVESTPKVY